jgi:hypothetical protein
MKRKSFLPAQTNTGCGYAVAHFGKAYQTSYDLNANKARLKPYGQAFLHVHLPVGIAKGKLALTPNRFLSTLCTSLSTCTFFEHFTPYTHYTMLM